MDSLPFFYIDNDDLLYKDLSDLDMLHMLDIIESFIDINEIDINSLDNTLACLSSSESCVCLRVYVYSIDNV